MDAGPQKESDTPQEAGRQRERQEEKEQKEKAFQGQARKTGGK